MACAQDASPYFVRWLAKALMARSFASMFAFDRMLTTLGWKGMSGRPLGLVLTTTSVGQEGLDFHAWCKTIVHWDPAAGPVELEQREGRVNRYGGVAIRQAVWTSSTKE